MRLPFNRVVGVLLGVVVRRMCEVEAGLSSLKHKQKRKLKSNQEETLSVKKGG